jgi:hypothetical protein
MIVAIHSEEPLLVSDEKMKQRVISLFSYYCRAAGGVPMARSERMIFVLGLKNVNSVYKSER